MPRPSKGIRLMSMDRLTSEQKIDMSLPVDHASASAIVSKVRVVDHAEVFTSEREISEMLDLVSHECERLESRFLEPACGTGNFLAEVLLRKFASIASKKDLTGAEIERNTLLAVTSLYGIEILNDNLLKCRRRLLNITSVFLNEILGQSFDPRLLKSAEKVLELNIIQGDALSLQYVGDFKGPIIFAEWAFIGELNLKRRDFTFGHLIEFQEIAAEGLFSDLGDNVYIPSPVSDYPVINYLELTDAY